MNICITKTDCRSFLKSLSKSDDGFSLIEALVAMVIFSLAAMALLSVQSESSRALIALEDKLLAEIVAENILVEQLSGGAIGTRQSGAVETGARNWLWTVKTSAVKNSEFTNIEISISNAADGQLVYSLNSLKVEDK